MHARFSVGFFAAALLFANQVRAAPFQADFSRVGSEQAALGYPARAGALYQVDARNALKSGHRNAGGVRYELSGIADLLRKSAETGATKVHFIPAKLGKWGTKGAAQLDTIIEEAGVLKILEIKSSLVALTKYTDISKWVSRVRAAWPSTATKISSSFNPSQVPIIKIVSPIDLNTVTYQSIYNKLIDLSVKYEKAIPFK